LFFEERHRVSKLTGFETLLDFDAARVGDIIGGNA
jgi:hypothetical protein